MKIEDLNCVLIIGAGTMGQQIGLQCALSGYDVILYDTVPEMLNTAIDRIKAYTHQLVGQGRWDQNQVNTALDKISATHDPEVAAMEADLVSESVPEDPELKRKVFAQFNELCPSHTVLTTNTSTLVPSMLAEASGRPAQFAALHFHGIMMGGNVVDIMPHPGTSPETIAVLRAFVEQIGLIPVYLEKEHPSYIFNAILEQVFKVATRLVADGVASVENVDRAWIGNTGMPVGPFGMLDVIGLDTVWQVAETQRKLTKDPKFQWLADFFKKYVDQGHLGVKSGRGFYTYPNPTFQQPEFLTGQKELVPA